MADLPGFRYFGQWQDCPVVNRGRVSQLDGLRGIAILLVVWYHSWGFHARYSGVVGVTVFYVLSGYLITGILLKEHDRRGSIDLKAFYARRALRLAPALVVTLLLTTAIMAVTGDPQLNHHYWVQLLSAATYTTNLVMATGVPMPILGHTWSLGIEEQFYFLWPLLLLGFLALKRGRQHLFGIILPFFLVFLSWRLIAPLVFSDWVRTYYGPDTVFFALLAGCLLAVAPAFPARVPTWVGYLGLLALFGLAAIPSIEFEGVDRTVLLYVGAITSVVTIPVIACAPRMRLLAARPLVLAGTLSYGWYLWHQVGLNLQPFGHAFTSVTERFVVVLATLGLAWLSFRFVEQPALRLKQRFERAEPNVGTTTPIDLRDGAAAPANRQ